MQRIYLTLLILLILSACRQRRLSNSQNNILTFKVLLSPSFDEKASFVLIKSDTQQVMQFLLLDREFPNKQTDTFYFKRTILTKKQFDIFDSLVIQKIKTRQPHQWTGCCDGMPVNYFLIQGVDTTNLHFRSPDIKSDSSGYQMTKAAIDQFKILCNDNIISDYLNDVESYMDESVHHINWKENRQINNLRKIEYSR